MDDTLFGGIKVKLTENKNEYLTKKLDPLIDMILVEYEKYNKGNLTNHLKLIITTKIYFQTLLSHVWGNSHTGVYCIMNTQSTSSIINSIKLIFKKDNEKKKLALKFYTIAMTDILKWMEKSLLN